eukprot:365510-Chlamydomonas_euryale.AAC.5
MHRTDGSLRHRHICGADRRRKVCAAAPRDRVLCDSVRSCCRVCGGLAPCQASENLAGMRKPHSGKGGAVHTCPRCVGSPRPTSF